MKKKPFAKRRKRPVLRNTQVFIAIDGVRHYKITNGQLKKHFNVFIDEKYVNPEEVGRNGNTVVLLFFPPTDSKTKVNY